MRSWALVGFAMAMPLPAVYLRFSGIHLGIIPDTLLFGLAIIGAAFLLSWAAEAAEVDISQGLAIAFLALIAVLPEYAVDLTFAWKAGQDPTYAQYAIANMTGANRLLVGLAWPLVFLLFWLKVRRGVLQLEAGHTIEIATLAAATLYAFAIPLRDEIGLYDTAVLLAIFAAYIYVTSRSPVEEPELVGPAHSIGSLPRSRRRFTIVALFVYAAAAILGSAEPFAEGLVQTGFALGIDEFLLVQWVAPLASESPEFLIAGLVALRGRGATALGILIASEVNQLTLLIAGLPVAYALSAGTLAGLPMDARQSVEVFLTAAQSAFGVAVLASLAFTWRKAAVLFGLFALQFVFPDPQARFILALIYIALVVAIFTTRRSTLPIFLATLRRTTGELYK